jgi:hypothetical protein
MDMRYDPLLGGMNLIGVAPTEGNLGLPNAQRIRVGASASSVLFARIASTNPALHMPKGSQIPDSTAVALFQFWIDSGLGTIDSDGDGVADTTDNCPYESNPTQADGGGWMSPANDGIGGACQCASVDTSPALNSVDLVALRAYLSGTGQTQSGVEERANYPDTSGRASILDSVRFKRALQGVEARPAQRCRAATSLLP